MNRQVCRAILFSVCVLTTMATGGAAHAHFLWLKSLPESGGAAQAFLFFGENVDDEAYHFPEKLAAIKVFRRGADGKRTEVVCEKLETEERVGRTAPLNSGESCVLEASGQYGVYETMLLNYYAKHVHAATNDKLKEAGPSKELKLDVVPSCKDGELTLTVLWKGEPLADAEVLITVGDEDVEGIATDDMGRVALRPNGEGLVGVLVNKTEDGVQGELNGKRYTSGAHYATLTFPWKKASAEGPSPGPSPIRGGVRGGENQGASAPADLPEALSSFGAVVADGWLYVYGGHTGEEHEHSAANLSKHFRRIRLGGTTRLSSPKSGSASDSEKSSGKASGTQQWEELPMQTPLQGLPIVAHGGNIYRAGGLEARNATKEDEEDLHSSAEFAEFDPATGKWTTLAPLPAPRSSHNAAVVEGKLYVVGGWALTGKSPGKWQSATVVYDFAKPDAGWQEVQGIPYKRRALAAAESNGKLVVLGGMDENGKISQRVDFFDPATGEWAQGPDLPGAGMSGFGVSAWSLDGELCVSGFQGILYRLNEAGSDWEAVTRLETPRFFHQLVPAAGGGLLAVGGASQDGHVADIEWLDVSGEASDAAASDDASDDAKPADAEAKRASEERPPPAAESRESRVKSQEPDVQIGASGSRFLTLDPQFCCPGDIWPAFRGNGTSLTSARDLPLEWSDDTNVAWKVELPGYGQSSPVVWRGTVFVTTMQGAKKETPTLLCFDLATGERRWQREFKSSREIEASNYVTRGSPTPAVDGQQVYAFFESGDLLALNHDGDVVWQRSLVDEYGDFGGIHGVGSSLAENDDTLFVLANHEGPSYLLAVDKATGENRWKVDYSGRVAWSSPIVERHAGRDVVVVSAAGFVEAYDGANGERLWNLDGFSGNNVPSATAVGEWVFVGSQEVASNVAINLTSGRPQVAWRSDESSCNFMSPLFLGGLVYMVNRSGVAFCVDAATGEQLWKQRLSDTCWASPLGAGDRVYFFAKDGQTVVARAGDKFERLADNRLTVDDDSRIYGYAAVDGALVLRTGTRLICVGNPGRA